LVSAALPEPFPEPFLRHHLFVLTWSVVSHSACLVHQMWPGDHAYPWNL
jgi:hypothetical protein